MQICKDKDNPDSKATTLGLFISLGVSENCFFFGFFDPLQTSLFP